MSNSRKALILVVFLIAISLVYPRVEARDYGQETYADCVYGTYIGPIITIDSPENITYVIKVIDLNVSAINCTPITAWFFNLNDNVSNVTFAPNGSVDPKEGQNALVVYATDTDGTNSADVEFRIAAKEFLLELYMTFEGMAIILFFRGFKRKNQQILYMALAMTLFASLAVLSGNVENFIGNVEVASWIGMSANFGLALVAFIFIYFAYLEETRKSLLSRSP